MKKGKLLILDDDRTFVDLLKRFFGKEYDVVCFCEPEKAVEYIRENAVDLILTDLSMPQKDGIEILQIVKSEAVETDVVIMTAYGSITTAVQAMKDGASDYIVKPFLLEELAFLLKNIFQRRRLLEENYRLKQFADTKYRPENLVGESERMRDLFRLIERIAEKDTTVLLMGESGTGKGLVAKALHQYSRRKERRFVSINCNEIPDALLESELFGHVRGAFSGAHRDKTGLFEYADGGTVFLDEIGDASITIQAKLLRVLQEYKFRPVGSNEDRRVDVRVLCATNKNMDLLIRENKFREDLFYRINVLSLALPPLRERRDDIPLLITHFLKGRKRIHPDAVGQLSRYEWPGNVRELKNMIEKLVALTDAETIKIEDLPPEIRKLPCILEEAGLSYSDLKRKVLDEFNRAVINKYLSKNKGSATRAAQDLMLDRANFQRLLRRYGVSVREFK